MANKKNWWLHLLKSIFTCEPKSKQEKEKTKGFKWIFDSFRFKQLPATSTSQKSLNEARDEQRKHALNVAKATAAAAEAAVMAAQAAAEVVRLTVARTCIRQPEIEVQNLSAIRIQTAYRAYLARKALRALKGVVRIQAIARGRAVRRRVSSTMKHIPRPSMHQHTHLLHSTHVLNTIDTGRRICDKDFSPRTSSEFGDRSKIECKSQRQWSDNLFSKEEIESVYLRRQEAVIRRERMRQYSFSHRERQYTEMQEETMPLRSNERQTKCLRKQLYDEDYNMYSKASSENSHSTSRTSDFGGSYLRIRPRNFTKQDFSEEVNSPFTHPRRSFCQSRLKPVGDDYQLSSSPNIFPTYMASTESAKAKMRSMSTPRRRSGYIDAFFDNGSPCIKHNNNKLYCSWSTYNGDHSLANTTISKANCSHSKSLTMEVLRQA